MKYCPITYEVISENEVYSQRGLKMLSPRLKTLNPLPFTPAEQRQEAIARAGKMSIQGVQPKLSARLNIKESKFDIVDHHGQYIIKPQSEYYAELPENEAITMSLAAVIGLEVPLHGLVYAIDNSFAYFIKRFDRFAKNKKLPLEDFAQLTGQTRDTKYNSSMEKVAKCIQKYCTFPALELIKLYKLTLFSFLVGNEDMHLKNFSLIAKENKVMLSPTYDLLNSTIAQPNTREELALPLNGKKAGLRKKDFMDYFGGEQLGLSAAVMDTISNQFKKALPQWQQLLELSFLSPDMKKKYIVLVRERSERLSL